MALVGEDFPDRLADAGLRVNVMNEWWTYGSSADHGAIVIHWTASGKSESPSSCVNYAMYADGYPHYNVIVDRTGVVWVLCRERSESSGKISGVALNEVLAGNANVDSAASRNLQDTTSANASLFAISAQNDGVGEPWSEELINGIAVTTAVALEALGLNKVGYVQHHCGLTGRKIDLSPSAGDSCPDRDEWYDRINDALQGGGPIVEEDEMYVIERELPVGTRESPGEIVIGLPTNRKDGLVNLFVDCPDRGGASLWGAQIVDGGAIGLWDDGRQWELWVPGVKTTLSGIKSEARQIRLRHMGGEPTNTVTVCVSGT